MAGNLILLTRAVPTKLVPTARMILIQRAVVEAFEGQGLRIVLLQGPEPLSNSCHAISVLFSSAVRGREWVLFGERSSVIC